MFVRKFVTWITAVVAIGVQKVLVLMKSVALSVEKAVEIRKFDACKKSFEFWQ